MDVEKTVKIKYLITLDEADMVQLWKVFNFARETLTRMPHGSEMDLLDFMNAMDELTERRIH